MNYGYLVEKVDGRIFCSKCRMKQRKIEEHCWFCGCFFTNYEEVILQHYHLKNLLKNKNGEKND